MARKHPLADCENCPLSNRPIAPTSGPQDSDTIIVSRSPGYKDAMNGTPFSGATGDVLNHLLKLNGVSRKEVRLTNVVLCAPPEGKIPTPAIKACSARLKDDISSAKLVIAAGAEAVKSICGMSIERARGYDHDTTVAGGTKQRTVATNNPALVLRDDSTFPDLIRDFRRAFNPAKPPTLPEVEVLEDAKDIARYLNAVPSNSVVAADIESRGGLTHKATLVSTQFSIDGGRATVLGEQGGYYTTEMVDLRTFLERPDLTFVWHNGVFDTKILRHTYGIKARIDQDTLLESYVLDERPGHHALEYLLMEEFYWPKYEDAEINKIKKTGIVTDYDKFYRYAGWDVAGTLQLHEYQVPKIKELDMWDQPYMWPILPAQSFLRDVELNGFKYNIETAADLYEDEIRPELLELIAVMRERLGKPIFNPRSSVQLAALYYDEWKVSHAMQDRPDMKRSVDDSARKEILAGRYKFLGQSIPGADPVKVADTKQAIEEVTEKLDRYKSLDKQASTYIVGLVKEAIDDEDGRIYTSLNLARTVTGRLSSTEPNLQNITRTKPGLPDIRKLFESKAGYSLVQADYGQAELRCIAEISGDAELTRVYTDGLDLHAIAAERFYGVDFIPEQRSKAKNMNFGVAFRQSAQTFQEKHGIPENEAQRFIDWWWKNFSGVYEWEKTIEKEVHKTGYIVSPFNRRRRFHLITKENRQAIYREAINFCAQSPASDLTLTSAIHTSNNIDQKRAAILLLVHDSIIAEVEDDYVDEYSNIVKQIMEETPKNELGWQLPFVADVAHGKTWAEAK